MTGAATVGKYCKTEDITKTETFRAALMTSLEASAYRLKYQGQNENVAEDFDFSADINVSLSACS